MMKVGIEEGRFPITIKFNDVRKQSLTVNAAIELRNKLDKVIEAEGLSAGLVCSFCKKGEGVVNQLITGPGVNICNECVVRCIQGMSAELEKL